MNAGTAARHKAKRLFVKEKIIQEGRNNAEYN